MKANMVGVGRRKDHEMVIVVSAILKQYCQEMQGRNAG